MADQLTIYIPEIIELSFTPLARVSFPRCRTNFSHRR